MSSLGPECGLLIKFDYKSTLTSFIQQLGTLAESGLVDWLVQSRCLHSTSIQETTAGMVNLLP